MSSSAMLRLLVALCSCHTAASLSPTVVPARPRLLSTPRHVSPRCEEYTEVQRLRAEAESPFSQVRLFAFPSLFAAASIAAYFAVTGLLASAAGLREASPTGVEDLLIDLAAMGTLGYLWKRELDARESKLKRIAFGSSLAALRIFQLVPDDDTALRTGGIVSLADLRRGRGQARRVVLVCASEPALMASLKGACASASRLAAADFLVVPLIASGSAAKAQLAAPPLEQLQHLASGSAELASIAASAASPVAARTETQPALPWVEAVPDVASGWPIVLPQSGGDAWTSVLSSDLAQAAKQDPAILDRGFTIVLKKNGRVSNRRLGTPNWEGLVSDVEGRKRAGLDVVNI